MIWRIRCAVIYSGGGGRVTKYEAQVRLLSTVFLATADACPWHICTCVQCIYIYFICASIFARFACITQQQWGTMGPPRAVYSQHFRQHYSVYTRRYCSILYTNMTRSDHTKDAHVPKQCNNIIR